jgi:hypothetical protein
MARSCGIRIGARRFELVALEGTVKKPKLIACVAGEIPPGENPQAAALAALREALRKHKLPVDNAGLAIDTGIAAFRRLTLPFSDREKIEQVLKFEVESQLPHLSIDEVVVDFALQGSLPNESRLLAIAVPKASLRPTLELAERAGIDALDAGLEAFAALNSAQQAGKLALEAAQILIHVGEASTAVMVVDGGELVAVRAIRIGALPPVPNAPAPVAAEGEAAPELPRATDAADALRRLKRELARAILSTHTERQLNAVLLCGFELEGLLDEDALPAPLERYAPVSDEEARAAGASAGLFAAAHGAALERLGAVWLPQHLRREDLHYAGKFERLELPLSVAGLVLVALLAVQLIVTSRLIQFHETDLESRRNTSNNYMLSNPASGAAGNLRRAPDAIKDYVARIRAGKETEREPYGQLVHIRDLLKKEIDRLRKELGQDSQITQPQSALEGLSLVLGVLSSMGEEQVGRVGLRELQADYMAGRAGKADTVSVRLVMSFFAEDDLTATRHYNDFVNELSAQPWCVEVPARETKPLPGGNGIDVPGLNATLDLSKISRAAPEVAQR